MPAWRSATPDHVAYSDAARKENDIYFGAMRLRQRHHLRGL